MRVNKDKEIKQMKGSEWIKYFKTLSKEQRFELHKAMKTIITDPNLKHYYGTDFMNLMMILEWDCGI